MTKASGHPTGLVGNKPCLSPKPSTRRKGQPLSEHACISPSPSFRGLPPTPQGFDLRLHTDGHGYIFSLKDSLDPCRYGIFSDEGGIVYEKTPFAAALIATQ
jgi:hypothetical protein